MRLSFIMALSLASLCPTFCFSQSATFDADSAYAYLEHLSVGIGPRPMGSANEWAALQWTKDKLRSFGADTGYVMIVPEARGTINTRSGVAIGIFRGTKDSTIVIGGHIDSASREVPGANDNASGTACLIELARVWSQRPRCFTLLFAAFGGEESGLVGSRYFVNHYSELDKVALMLQIDMAGSTEALIPFIEVHTHQAPIWLVEDAFAIDRALGYNSLKYPTHFFSLNFAVPGGAAGSDHEPFLEKNIPAIDFTAGVNTSPIHTQQDRIDLISKPMLARSGRIVDGLIAKYQVQGIPASRKGAYMLWQVFDGRLFVPTWLIIVINILAVLLGGLALIHSRKHRLQIEKSHRVKFSGFKLVLMMVIIAIFTQFGEAIMQELKGLRYPWFIPFNRYLWFAMIWTLAGVWVVSQLTRIWRFSPDPYVYAKRALIFLLVYIILLALVSWRLALYPTLSLIALCLSIFLPGTLFKIIFTVLAPIPMFRLMFFELLEFGARISANSGHGLNTLLEAFFYSAGITLILVFWFLPMLYLFAYTFVCSFPRLNVLRYYRHPIVGLAILLAIFGYGGYLYAYPAYDNTWRSRIQVNAEYDVTSGKSGLRLTGNEYFRRVTVSADTLKRYYNARIHEDEFAIPVKANWLNLIGTDSVLHGERDTVAVHWQIISAKPWYRTSLNIHVDTLTISNIKSNLKYWHDDNDLTFSWYAEPPETLHVSARFVIFPGARLMREVKAVYPEIPIPIKVMADLAEVIYRTTVTYRDTLKFSMDKHMEKPAQ
ncbi:MAG: M28 family metallopeptidase [candidate division KSB1 bacterium]|nr:M28 family metallopeptidase [candidate division KSB1 bacterium]MDZ7302961.1 M28 family metallopeptidase [candidate division KSB1 bacterium]MDZ7312237.1 M28 family metallopeptidase [candidate division KSB1 bacterium]